MERFDVTDIGGGIIRIDADTTLMRKAMAEAICHEVEVAAAPYDSFKVLMNLGAISKGTPAAGLHTLREMKKYNLSGLALFRANRFMKGMAGVVLGLARFENFSLFASEDDAMDWLKNPTPSGDDDTAARRRRIVPAVALVGGGAGAAWLARRRRRG